MLDGGFEESRRGYQHHVDRVLVREDFLTGRGNGGAGALAYQVELEIGSEPVTFFEALLQVTGGQIADRGVDHRNGALFLRRSGQFLFVRSQFSGADEACCRESREE